MKPDEVPWQAIEEPTRHNGSRHSDYELTHPAFGMIRADRVSGDANLTGSDFSHQHYVQVTVYDNTRFYRSLSNDHFHAGNELVRLSLSEAQWVSLVANMNSQATPCTLRHVQGQPRAQLPIPVKKADEFKREAAERLQRVSAEHARIESLITASGLSKVKQKEILDSLRQAQMNLNSNLGFVLDQFGEHMEVTTEKAKVEIEAYAHDMIVRTGLAALGKMPISGGVLEGTASLPALEMQPEGTAQEPHVPL